MKENNSIKNIDLGLTNATSEEVINRINKEFEKYNTVCISTREFGSIVIDCSLLKKRNGLKLIFFRLNGTSTIEFINVYGKDKKFKSEFFSLIEISYNESFIFSTKWYVSNVL